MTAAFAAFWPRGRSPEDVIPVLGVEFQGVELLDEEGGLSVLEQDKSSISLFEIKLRIDFIPKDHFGWSLMIHQQDNKLKFDFVSAL